jgi:SAM-dependent methyltransferase
MSESSAQLEPSANGAADEGSYELRDGIFVPREAVVHDDGQYDNNGYRILNDMQRRHFWHRGRHRFLAAAVRRHPPARGPGRRRVIDLGAGCGGWMAYLVEHGLFADSELALADSSPVALAAARDLVPGKISCYQVDLLNLRFRERWDVAFLLDVIEHLDDDRTALVNAYQALAPGGVLFITVPALQAFWSWNDEVVRHKRRYSTGQLRSVAESAGFKVLDLRYFMFLLSPLLLVSRRLGVPRLEQMDKASQWALVEKSHRVPPAAINELLAGVFAFETPASRWLKFPWGTSALGVFTKPG